MSAKAGWYPDPGGGQGLFRYWDGKAWSAATSPNPKSPPPTQGVIGAAPQRSGPDPAAIEAVRKLIDAGARPRVAASVVADLTATPANDLYRATAT